MTDPLLFTENHVTASVDAIGHGFDITIGIAQESDCDIGATGFAFDDCQEKITGHCCQLTPDQITHRAGQVHAKFSFKQTYFMYFLNFII